MTKLLFFATIIAAGLSALLGGTIIFGWHTQNIALIQIHSTFVPMQYNTAVGFLLCGIGILSMSFNYKRLAMICGGTICTIGILTLAEYVFGANLGIDQLLMEHYITVETSNPGRMAPNTALCFGLSGLALLIMRDTKRLKWYCHALGYLASIIIALGVVAFFGYLSGTTTAYGWGNLTRMAIHTATGFIVVGTGLFMFAWREETVKNKGEIPRWFAFVIGIGVLTTSVALWEALNVQLGPQKSYLPLAVLGDGLLTAVLLVVVFRFAQTSRLYKKNILLNNKLEEDITERKKVQEALRVSEEKFSKAFNSTPTLVGIADIETLQRIEVNETFIQISGYSREELLNSAICSLGEFVPEQIDQFLKLLKQNGSVREFEVKLRTKTGQERLMLYSGEVFEMGGREYGIVSGLDITERKQAEQTLKESDERYKKFGRLSLEAIFRYKFTKPLSISEKSP